MTGIHIRILEAGDIPVIAAACAALGWHKPASQYEAYLDQQQADQRIVLLATVAGEFAGYVTVVWQSSYQPFQAAGIPEIVDLNVLPSFRRRGLASRLLDAAEARVMARSTVAGIGVGLTEDYGPAQVLYVRRGYIPDGRGVAWNGQPCQFDDPVRVDDGLVLYFTKQLAT